MRQEMHGIIVISNSLGYLDIFVNITCNPNWPEIQNSVLLDQRADGRPELCDRVFRKKQKLLLKHLNNDKPFGQITAFVSVIEFQKRGLVHAQIIIFLDQESNFSLQGPTNIDRVISVEISPVASPHLRGLMLKYIYCFMARAKRKRQLDAFGKENFLRIFRNCFD